MTRPGRSGGAPLAQQGVKGSGHVRTTIRSSVRSLAKAAARGIGRTVDAGRGGVSLTTRVERRDARSTGRSPVAGGWVA